MAASTAPLGIYVCGPESPQYSDNTTFAGTLEEGQVASQPLDVFVASDDQEANGTVKQLAEDGGLRSIDAAPLARARKLEALGFLHMALQEPLGTGYGRTVKVLA